ncbi:MAG: hypothetical protein J0L72_10540 [Armatimonadetes bacterium]|nr:hypothetical protein [Armatimonadota bacterium]
MKVEEVTLTGTGTTHEIIDIVSTAKASMMTLRDVRLRAGPEPEFKLKLDGIGIAGLSASQGTIQSLLSAASPDGISVQYHVSVMRHILAADFQCTSLLVENCDFTQFRFPRDTAFRCDQCNLIDCTISAELLWRLAQGTRAETVRMLSGVIKEPNALVMASPHLPSSMAHIDLNATEGAQPIVEWLRSFPNDLEIWW